MYDMVDFGSPAWNAMKAGQTPSWESVKQIYTQNGRTFRDFVADYYPNGPGANQELRIPPRPNPEVPGESQVLDWPAIKQAWQQRLGARVPATQSSGGPPALPPSSTGASAGAPQPGGAVEPYVMQGQAIPPEGAPGGAVASRPPTTLEGVLADLSAGGGAGAGGGGSNGIPIGLLQRLFPGAVGAGLGTLLRSDPANSTEVSGETRDRLDRMIAEGLQRKPIAEGTQLVAGGEPYSVQFPQEQFTTGNRPNAQRRPVIPARPAVMTPQFVPEKPAVAAESAPAPAPAPAPEPVASQIPWDKIWTGGGARS